MHNLKVFPHFLSLERELLLMLNMQIKLNEFEIIIRFLTKPFHFHKILFFFPKENGKSFVVIMPAFHVARERERELLHRQQC